MSGRMPIPRMLAYTVSTRRALIGCGDHVVWMTAEDLDNIADAWSDLADDVQSKNDMVEMARDQ